MLTREHKLEFHRNGFLVLHGAVDRELVDQAREVVWESIEEDPHDTSTWTDGNRSEWPADMNDDGPFRQLNDVAAEYCAELLDEESLTYEGDSNLQIALRFPGEERLTDPDAPQISDVTSHVDGTLDVKDGEGEVVPHTINSTIYLNRVQPYGGGFTAWPGSHRDVCRFLEDRPIQEVQGGIPAPDGNGGWDESRTRDEVFDPVEVVGGPGTLTLWHGRLEHEGGINLSPGTVRMAAIKRFFHRDAGEFQETAPEDPYRGWTGMQEVR